MALPTRRAKEVTWMSLFTLSRPVSDGLCLPAMMTCGCAFHMV
jgi:hypothetical protein